MAKKSRRARAATKVSAVPQSAATSQAPAQGQVVRQKSTRQPAVAAGSVAPAVNYDYVRDDLLRIGIISAALIVILIVLTFIPALKT